MDANNGSAGIIRTPKRKIPNSWKQPCIFQVKDFLLKGSSLEILLRVPMFPGPSNLQGSATPRFLDAMNRSRAPHKHNNDNHNSRNNHDIHINHDNENGSKHKNDTNHTNDTSKTNHTNSTNTGTLLILLIANMIT